ncbi:group II decarboxylase family protein [Neisseria lactamica]|uniref:Group II decarboxylase family protein n=1 Tax=Neisseria lactamica TaxID=486 RepID=A0A378VPB2_NEILA|nr:group II decarboxylase family protein [Neisseria lactamica]
MQRQTPGIVALAEDNREDAAVRIGCVVSVPVWAGRNVRFFCSDAFEYPSDSVSLQRVFLFGRKSIPPIKKAFCPTGRLVPAVSQNFALMRPIGRDGLQTALFCRFTGGIRASYRWAEAARHIPWFSVCRQVRRLRRRNPKNNPRAPRL